MVDNGPKRTQEHERIISRKARLDFERTWLSPKYRRSRDYIPTPSSGSLARQLPPNTIPIPKTQPTQPPSANRFPVVLSSCLVSARPLAAACCCCRPSDLYSTPERPIRNPDLAFETINLRFRCGVDAHPAIPRLHGQSATIQSSDNNNSSSNKYLSVPRTNVASPLPSSFIIRHRQRQRLRRRQRQRRRMGP